LVQLDKKFFLDGQLRPRRGINRTLETQYLSIWLWRTEMFGLIIQFFPLLVIGATQGGGVSLIEINIF
jgi:hypothetical protein